MANIIIVIILLLVVGSACFYIWKNKKKGIKCIGCPYAEACGGGCSQDATGSKAGHTGR